ncbi:MAG: hypothetical protein R2727_05495 [Bacteroidales bacterium]
MAGQGGIADPDGVKKVLDGAQKIKLAPQKVKGITLFREPSKTFRSVYLDLLRVKLR